MAIILPNALNELKTFRQWVAWRAKWDGKKMRKPPVNPHTGEYAAQNNPDTWGTFEQAMSRATDDARAQGMQVGQGHHGVGFEFGDASGIAGIDLDHVIREDGSMKDFAADIVRTMDSYTELSPSGRGLHILFRVDDARGLIRELFGDTEQQGTNNQELGAELYLGKHYFTITGEKYGDEKPISERTKAMRTVYGKYFAKPKPAPQSPSPVNVSPEDLTDGELWDRMFNNQTNGRDIQALYNGNLSGYGDDWSRADLALCDHLAFWTGKDAGRMDRMFRQSGLMRDKWERADYRERAIQKGIDSVSGNGYSPEYGKEIYRSSQEGRTVTAVTESASCLHKVRYISQYLDTSIEADIGRFQRYSHRKTGYSNIDARTSLYPGLYVLGAVSSLGKTTFAHQMADQIARAGDHVLFFVLEQTELELVTKGLARLTAQEDMTSAITAMEIRSGRITDAVRRAIAEYKSFSSHEAIIECDFNTTIEQITGTVREYIRKTGAKPVVFVDYLQLIRPSLMLRQTTKEAVDEHVRAFKQLQRDNDLVIILISSLNRQNYLTTIDFEAFKETGGIEYTADVIWGLQLAVMNAEIFDSKEKLKTKRELVRAAKRESPRKIELCVLKNRYGIATGKYGFDYYARYDLFLPVNEPESPSDEISDGIKVKHKGTRI